jgi:hypothetical protein
MSERNQQYGYLWEKFYQAASHLAGARDRVQRRVADAYATRLLLLNGANHPEMPSEIRTRMDLYDAEFAKQSPKGGEGTIRAWAEGLSEDQACEVADWIFEAFLTLEKLYYNIKE